MNLKNQYRRLFENRPASNDILLLETSATASDAVSTFFLKMLALRDQAHIYHWQTTSFAQHDAYGKFYDQYLILVDTIAENIMGVTERPKFEKAEITLEDFSASSLNTFTENVRKLFTDELSTIVDKKHTSIYNIADEIVSLANKMQYVLTLK